MKISTLFKSTVVLSTSLLFAACGGSSGTSDMVVSSKEEPENVIESFPTTGLIDLKNYIPQTDTNVTFLVSDGSVNVNGQVTYAHSDGITRIASTHDGMDLDDYIAFDKFINFDAAYREAFSSMEFGSNYFIYTIDGEESSRPRFYENNDSVTLTLQFEYTADFTVSTESESVHYTDAYESNSSVCSMLYVGDYSIAGTHYSDAIELSCFGNRSKGGTVNGVPAVAYDYNYTSLTILLPSMGIVSVDYRSPDLNYTVAWPP